MKKRIALLLAAVLCLSFAACSKPDSKNPTTDAGKIPDSGKDYTVFSAEWGEVKVITKEKMMGFAKVVELTPENWKDYFTVEEVKNEIKNEAGQVTGTEVYYKLRVAVGDAFAYTWYNADTNDCSTTTVDFKDPATGKITAAKFYGGGYYFDGKKTLDDFEFIRSTGKLVLFKDIPESYWNKNTEGVASVCYGDIIGEGDTAELNAATVVKGSLATGPVTNGMLSAYFAKPAA